MYIHTLGHHTAFALVLLFVILIVDQVIFLPRVGPRCASLTCSHVRVVFLLVVAHVGFGICRPLLSSNGNGSRCCGVLFEKVRKWHH